VAVPLPVDARDALAKQLPANFPGRRVPPDKWHFTLRFLGVTAPALRDRLMTELNTEALGAAFRVRLARLGAFPEATRARVLWVGVADGAERFRLLARVISAACNRAGLQSDERPYAPHLTVSRVDPPRDLREVLRLGEHISVQTIASEVLLVRSQLAHGPSRYETLARYTLTSAA
jgi:RNA 2',3'-cyclic 3'-phosphodiesterase